MADGGQAQHHIDKRKRVHEKGEKYPHPVKWKRAIDKLSYVVGFLGPLLALPQLISIWTSQSVVGVSVFSWIGFTFVAMFWLTYASVHKVKPLIITYSLWVVFDIIIVIGIFRYG